MSRVTLTTTRVTLSRLDFRVGGDGRYLCDHRSEGYPGKPGYNTYNYSLGAVPQANSSTLPQLGSPINGATSTGCGFASAGSGTYSSTLCLVDFSALTSNNLLAAEQGGCLEITATLPGNYQLYFCVQISGAPVAPWRSYLYERIFG